MGEGCRSSCSGLSLKLGSFNHSRLETDDAQRLDLGSWSQTPYRCGNRGRGTGVSGRLTQFSLTTNLVFSPSNLHRSSNLTNHFCRRTTCPDCAVAYTTLSRACNYEVIVDRFTARATYGFWLKIGDPEMPLSALPSIALACRVPTAASFLYC